MSMVRLILILMGKFVADDISESARDGSDD